VSDRNFEFASGLGGYEAPRLNIINNCFRTANSPYYRHFHDPIVAWEFTTSGQAAPKALLHVNSGSYFQNTCYTSGNHFERWDDQLGDFVVPYQPSEQWDLTEEVSPGQQTFPDLNSNLIKSSAWTMPSDGANLSLDPEDVLAAVTDDTTGAGCLPRDSYDQSLVTAYFNGNKLYTAYASDAYNTYPGQAYSPSPPHDKHFETPVTVPSSLSWTGFDETESFEVQWRGYVAPPGDPQPWNTIGYPNATGSGQTANISCSGLFSANNSYEWRVIPRNTCYFEGYNVVQIPVWRFKTTP
jgi:hypothetical protein